MVRADGRNDLRNGGVVLRFQHDGCASTHVLIQAQFVFPGIACYLVVQFLELLVVAREEFRVVERIPLEVHG